MRPEHATAMRLYGRQSRVRARRRRVLLESRRRAGAARDPARASRAAARRRRARRARGRRAAGRSVAGTGRARDPAAVGDQLQRDVTVNVAGRSATRLALRPRRARRRGAHGAGRSRRRPGARRAALLARRTRARSRRCLRYPKHFALPVELANVTQAPVDARLVLKPSGAAIAVPAKAGVGFDPAERAAAIARAALADRSDVSLQHRAHARRDLDAPPRGAPRRGSRSCCSAPIAFTRRGQAAGALARAPARAAAHGDDLQAPDRRAVRPPEGRRRAAAAALRVPAAGRGRELEGRRAIARACSPRSAASTSTRARTARHLTTAGAACRQRPRGARSRSGWRSRS